VVAPDVSGDTAGSGAPDPLDYRDVISRFATGVTVVSTVHQGVRYGMTVSSLTSVSLQPVLLLFCCERDSTLHAPLLAAGSWAVSVLSPAQVEISRFFATHGEPGRDQFTEQEVAPGPHTGAPLLRNAVAWLECRTWAAYDGGDHTIVVGEVVDVRSGSDEPPLLYYRGGYRRLDLGE
jgi:flavin reductase (DIM6/NTAB) family NADH-FMN oxidoreductase RutF